MPIHLEVTTFNQAKNNEGGYHEIHRIKFLSSPEHAFITTQNIITNNRAFGDSDCYLVAIEIICNQQSVYKYLKEQYQTPGNISISIVLNDENEE